VLRPPVISTGSEFYPVFCVNVASVLSSGVQTIVIIINKNHHPSQNCQAEYKISYQVKKATFYARTRKKEGKD